MNAHAPTAVVAAPDAPGLPGPEPSAGTRWAGRIRLASVFVLVLSLVMIVRALPLDRLIELLARRVDAMGIWAPIVFGVAYVVAAVLFVPGSALTLAAGATFGLALGTLTVSVASTTGAALAFLIARYAARGTVGGWAARSPRFSAIDRAIAEGGWKVIALLRLSPAVPFSLGNYLFGLTSIRFWPYVLASWIAMAPGTFLYVYLGHVGRSGLAAASSDSSHRSPGEWAALLVGLLATVVVTVYVTRLARRALESGAAMHPQASQVTNPGQATGAHSAGSGRRGTVALVGSALALAVGAGFAQACQRRLASLFGPPAATLREAYAEKADGPHVDHARLDALLQRYVDADGYVDYAGLKQDASALDAYVLELAKVPFDQLGRSERLALLLNAYNAFTLRLILDHYPVRSIKDIPDAQRWDDVRWVLGGRRFSLNMLEHEQIRPNFKEPRIHFALVCAAVGCPPLRNEAYVASRLEDQLQSQALYVHAHARWLRFDADAGRLGLTALYDWYGKDFEQVAGSVVEHAARYAPALRRGVDAGRIPKVTFLDYDWALNSRENRR